MVGAFPRITRSTKTVGHQNRTTPVWYVMVPLFHSHRPHVVLSFRVPPAESLALGDITSVLLLFLHRSFFSPRLVGVGMVEKSSGVYSPLT